MGVSVIIKKAPIGILVSYCNLSDNVEYSDYIQSASHSYSKYIVKFLLKRSEFMLGHSPTKKTALRQLFNIPPISDSIAYVLIGYAEKEPRIVQ